jgi:hypothetical protein
MKKLKLDPGDLRVEPFVTNPGTQPDGGTVFGKMTLDGGATCDPTYQPQATCHPYNTCLGNGCGGGGSAFCYGTPGCPDDSRNLTCDCANLSWEGWGSCGGSCADETCETGCEWYISYPGAHC